jgi:hypothetical protein
MGKKKKDYELRVGWFDEEKMTCKMSKVHVFNVIAKKRTTSWTEKEDAGGGCYWAGKGIKKTGEVTDYFVYDGDNYIGEILPSGSAHFMDKHNRHVKVPLTSLPFLKTFSTQ